MAIQLDIPCHVISLDSVGQGTMFVCRNGDVYAKGWNSGGNLAMGGIKKVEKITRNDHLKRIVKITGGGPRIGMTTDGKFYGWGDQRRSRRAEWWANSGFVRSPISMDAPKGAMTVFSYSTSVFFLLRDGRAAELIPEKSWFFNYEDTFKDYHFRYYSY